MTALLTPPVPGIQLRHYQQAAVTGALRAIAGGKKAPMIVSPTGTGKMVIISEILKRAYLKGNTALFVVHRREMVKQCSEKLTLMGVPHSFIMPGHNPGNLERVYVGTVQSMTARARRGTFDPLNVRVIVIDECFPAGTMVDGKPIETLKPGDMVQSYNHDTDTVEMRPVRKLFRNPVKELVRLTFSDGAELVCTPNHPVAVKTTEGWEYVAAGVTLGYTVMRNEYDTFQDQSENLRCVRKNVHAPELEQHHDSDVFTGMQSGQAQPAEATARRAALHALRETGASLYVFGAGTSATGPRVLQRDLQEGRSGPAFIGSHGPNEPQVCIGQDEGEQPNGEPRNAGRYDGDPQENWTQAENPGRKRKLHDPANDAGRRAGLGNGSGSEYRSEAGESRGTAVPLQVGHSESDFENLYRGGRQFAHRTVGQAARCEEDGVSGVARVVSVEILQQRGADGFGPLCADGHVYNIEVEGNHNYFAGNTLVHNCHHATAQSYRTLIEAYPNAVVVGLTATPCRADGAGMGNVFDALVQATTYTAALEEGYLVKPRYYAPYTPDLSDVTTRAGDYAEDDLEREMNQPQLVGDIVQHYAKLAADRQGIVFATRVRHSLALCAEFIRAGFTAFHIDGTTPTDERDELMQQFRDGDLQIMVNVGVATEGLDVPNVGAVVLARPTKSVSLHMQMIGRGLRPAEGKDCTLILDHAGNTVRLGPVEIRESWSLDQKKGKSKKKKDREPKEITCDECSAIFYGTRTCPQCGHIHEYERAPLDMEVVDGELVEIGEQPMVYTTAMKQGFYRQLLHYADNHGKKPGWAYHTYRARWGVYPIWGSGDHRVHPTPEVIAWINGHLKQQRIAWAKRQEKLRKIEQLNATGE